jgi:hypothetical protein
MGVAVLALSNLSGNIFRKMYYRSPQEERGGEEKVWGPNPFSSLHF